MKVEICCASIEAIQFARENQIDRIELCQALEIGGLTSSLALLTSARDSQLLTAVLIRPRIGNFIYSQTEKELILNDIKLVSEMGFNEFVVGALNSHNELDYEFLEELISKNSKLNFTFHRAFDELKNPLESLEQLIHLGFKRILTSGGAKNVENGIEQIKKCKEIASKRIEIMIGGGISEQNCQLLISTLNPDAIHFSGTILEEESNALFAHQKLIFSGEKAGRILNLLSKD